MYMCMLNVRCGGFYVPTTDAVINITSTNVNNQYIDFLVFIYLVDFHEYS
jgi:hypothetical protein